VEYEDAVRSPYVNEYDFIAPYVEALADIVDMGSVKRSGLKLAADPLGGSAIGVYEKINQIYGLEIDIINRFVDPTFSFMTLDGDGKIRMDCSSPWAMASLLKLKGSYDLAFGNDTDADRHGIVTPEGGLMNPNHYLCVAIWYLFKHWTTDKDGIIMNLLAAEIKAVTGRDPASIYADLESEYGKSYYRRIDAPATPQLKNRLKKLDAEELELSELAGEKIERVYTVAPGNGAAIGGVKIVAENGWIAMRPSGTEDIYKIYAESFRSKEHLEELLETAGRIVSSLSASK